MAENSRISWTRSTFNPWIGCARVGPGCDNCYAETLDSFRRFGGATHWGAGVPRLRTSPGYWRQPYRWHERAAQEKEAGVSWNGRSGFWPVFCASLADVFDNEVPQSWRDQLFEMIELTPRLTWQLVTKRIGNARMMAPARWSHEWPANVWVIATTVDQEEFDRDWPKLRAVPARVRGISAEPLLGSIRFPSDAKGELHWVIYGGESLQRGVARPCDIKWIADGIIRECRSIGAAPFVKQLGSLAYLHSNGHRIEIRGSGKMADPSEWHDDLRVQEFPEC